MNYHFIKRRLKIAEQIIIVIFFAVIIPMTISGVFINNINQHSNRTQLKDAAIVIANIVSEEVDIFKKSINNELTQISTTLDYYNSPEKSEEYLNTIMRNMKFYKELKIVPQNKLKTFEEYELKNDYLVYTKKLANNNFLTAVIDIKTLQDNIYKTVVQDKRQIYVLAGKDNKLLASVNYDKNVLRSSIEQLPQNLVSDTSVIFGKIKNQPLAYHKKSNPDVIIIVNTTEDVTKFLIDENRNRILLSIFLTMLAVFFVVGLYTSYLYTNIRQLFKAIIAISKGNYARRIRLLTNIFTPFEIVFLGNEFNRMVGQIHKSYIQLNKKNKELKQLNEFRSNMIDTVSHEFRTPLTSIQGYTSRLLRSDIEIDEETRKKSLQIIKRQAERLKRMIEDILVIPDIEGKKLSFEMQPLNISNIIENVLNIVRNNQNKCIINNISDCNIEISSNHDRLEQVFVNLIENALKYGKDGYPVELNYELKENKLIISIQNEYDIIPREKLKTLFDKFTRIDDSTTRTTRGTGLGLYIVKSLIENMNGEVRLYSNEDCGFCVKVYLPLATTEKI